MAIERELLSTEKIKPSSPTPSHLQHYQFSFLDQINPPVFMPFIFFYKTEDDSSKISDRLKTSLSEALTLFYPLAGRVIDNAYINCNDEGVPYVTARCKSRIFDFISGPNPNELNKFLPYELDDVKDLPLVIQTTFFEGGGIAIGVGISHKVTDACSFILLVKAWAAISREDLDHVVPPKFGCAQLFPPINTKGFKPTIGIVKDTIVTKRFVFTAAKIASLREKYAAVMAEEEEAADDKYPRPTRIEALSAFIWSRFMAATELIKAESSKCYTVLQAVNLRTRTNPPLPNNLFGNLSRIAVATPCMEDDRDLRGGIIRKMRKAVCDIDNDYVKKLEKGENHLNFIKERGEKSIRGELVTVNFTSLSRFPIYEVDFGWGKPAWVGSARMVFKNLMAFMDTPSGDGIEVYVNLKEEDMRKFEMDEELLSYISSSNNSTKNLAQIFI